MARGRHQKWVCKDCKAEFQVQGHPPKLCCFCGSRNIGRAPSFDLAISYEEKKRELRVVCVDLNSAYERYRSLREQYDKLMAYWKQQRRRGFISREEYDELAAMFTAGKSENDPNMADTTGP